MKLPLHVSRMYNDHHMPALVGSIGIILALLAVPGIAAEDAPQATVTADDPGSDPQPVEPCLTGPSTKGPCIDPDKIPRFVKNSPFGGSNTPGLKKERRLWADKWLWADAPKLVVEKWLGDKPDTKGKYVLIEFWAPWCPPCRRSLSLLNELHEKFGDELVVIGVCEENEETTRRLNEDHPETAKIEFYSAVDTQKRVKDELGVWGIPHVILLEPVHRCVIWEGFPLQEGYELTDELIEKFLAVGRKSRANKVENSGE